MVRVSFAKLAALGIALGALGAATPVNKAPPSKAWAPDNGDGTYKNPVLFADYSDPDVIRVDRDFYLVASSFNAIPGLPILRSRDLVSWQLVGHVLDGLEPRATYDTPVHGGGVWAPSIRKHGSLFYVY